MKRTLVCQLPSCGSEFEASRSDAKWCSKRCSTAGQSKAVTNARLARYREANRDTIKATQARWYARNRDQAIAASRSWQRRNRARVARAQREWCARNPEKVQAFGRSRRARVRNAPGGGVTAIQWRQVLHWSEHQCVYCCRIDVPLTLDHLIPLIRGGWHDISNAVPACLSCNSSKNDSLIEDWMPDFELPPWIKDRRN